MDTGGHNLSAIGLLDVGVVGVFRFGAIKMSGVYNLYDKLLFKVDLNLGLQRYAKVYQSGPDVGKENNQYYYNLGNIIDGNLGIEYRYNKRISGFLQINNVASQRYQQFYNYPVIPLQVLAGITFKF